MSLPSFLLAEVRSTFRLCAQQHASTKRRPFTVSSVLLKRKAASDKPSKRQPSIAREAKSLSERPLQDAPPNRQAGIKELTTTEEDGKSLETESKPRVPMKVLPEAQLTSKHKLSPMQRLHIEHLTRHPPKQQVPKGRQAGGISQFEADDGNSVQRKTAHLPLWGR